ncbi:hypothetical protein [Luteolibacter marinus]|uniref:hypothetical protein n=1 Tax=Luteolibacter marinus TaxID=2776705 RepID=UPI001867C0EE|nr:hypothetical protein [Luteolibacter marinus]
MSPRSQTIGTLVGAWLVLETPLVLAFLVGETSAGVPVTLGLVGGLFCFLAFRKKTWARHLVLLHLGYKIAMIGLGSLERPSLPVYTLLAAQCFLFWALCWHRPVLGYLGVVPAGTRQVDDAESKS